MQVLGHRGWPHPTHPENSLAAVDAALSTGADGVEVDVRMTADGVAVCCHDDDLTRVTGTALSVRRSTWAQLQQVRLRDGSRLPLLGEVLEQRLTPLVRDGVGEGRGLRAVRVRGLWAGLDIEPGGPSGRELSERLMTRGILAKDTHGSTIRIAPPIVITEDEIGMLVDSLADALAEP